MDCCKNCACVFKWKIFRNDTSWNCKLWILWNSTQLLGRYLRTLLQENYPHVAPIWFSECDDSTVTAILQSLTEAEAPCYILPQTYELVSRLCSYYNVTIPTELISIGPVSFSITSRVLKVEFTYPLCMYVEDKINIWKIIT